MSDLNWDLLNWLITVGAVGLAGYSFYISRTYKRRFYVRKPYVEVLKTNKKETLRIHLLLRNSSNRTLHYEMPKISVGINGKKPIFSFWPDSVLIFAKENGSHSCPELERKEFKKGDKITIKYVFKYGPVNSKPKRQISGTLRFNFPFKEPYPWTSIDERTDDPL